MKHPSFSDTGENGDISREGILPRGNKKTEAGEHYSLQLTMYLKALQPLCNFYSELVCLLPDHHYKRLFPEMQVFFQEKIKKIVFFPGNRKKSACFSGLFPAEPAGGVKDAEDNRCAGDAGSGGE